MVDRGFSSADNLVYLRRAGGHYIAGTRTRVVNALVAPALARQGRYRGVRDNVRVKEVRLDGTDVRFVICHNPEQVERDKLQRQQAVARIGGRTGARQGAAQAPPGQDHQARDKAEAAQVKAECELRDHPTLGRWIRQVKSGRLVIDRAKVTAEQRLDGRYLLATSGRDISAEDTALGYKMRSPSRAWARVVLGGADGVLGVAVDRGNGAAHPRPHATDATPSPTKGT